MFLPFVRKKLRDISQKPSTIQRTFLCRFLSIGEEKMSPLSKKRGHHDLRILRFGRIASTAAVRTHGNFGSIPSPLSHCCHQYEWERLLRNMPLIGSTSIMIVGTKLTAVPKMRRGVHLPRSRCRFLCYPAAWWLPEVWSSETKTIQKIFEIPIRISYNRHTACGVSA